MTLRPVAAHWFELVTVHQELARVMECLSRTGAVELEARSQVSEHLLFPGLDDAIKAHHEMARHYRTYWPAAAATAQRQPEDLGDTLKSARQRLSAWAQEADPIIATIEHLTQDIANLMGLHDAVQSAGLDFPDLHELAQAGPKLQSRLLILPAGTTLRELPAMTLFKSWQRPDATYVLIVGRTTDIADVEAQLPALKGHAAALPPWLPSSTADAVNAIAKRIADIGERRAAQQRQLDAMSERLRIAPALGDMALIEWLNAHAKDLRGSQRLAWVTGWTSDVGGKRLRAALERCDVRYILRLTEAPEGMSAPMVLHNPPWARAFEVFAGMLGTPGQYESDPSQLLAVIASSIFGFMFGDVGQGAVVMIAGLVFGRSLPMARMLVPGGAMAMVFGVLFGSVFGLEHVIPALWLRPMEQPITLLIVAVVAGMAIIALGLMLDAMQMHWRGEALQWWGHRAGLTVAYIGLIMMSLEPLRQDGLLIAAFGTLWFILGAVALADDGRLAALAPAAAGFVEQVLRLLVNTVSFARVGAFALAHAGLSVAIVEMAQASGRYGFWIVLALGNVLVIALEGMVVSIQTTRLLLFEFFIRFLTGTGRAFKPLPPPTIVKDQPSEHV
jgi:V/A-type H+-transporting ATPase subunit I